MKQKRVLSVQDISCFGKCSNTVALPLLSAADIETVVLPTALLSTHTGGFQNFTFLDLTEEMHRIMSHWAELGITFDVIYTGYFGSAAQLNDVASFRNRLLAKDGFVLVDPVMGDRGKLYSIYDDTFVRGMRAFCRGADLITPNVTEACLLAGVPYTGDRYDPAHMNEILEKIAQLGCRTAVITGVHFGEEEIGVVCREFAAERPFTLSSPRSDAPLHGTGDVFASALLAYLANGFALREALQKAVRFVSAAIRETEEDLTEHWYGLKFESCLASLSDDIRMMKIRRAME